MAELFDEDFFSIDALLNDEANMEDNQSRTSEESDEINKNQIHEEPQQQPKSRKQLTVMQKREMVDAILLKLDGEDFPRGFLSQIAINFNIHRSTTLRLFTKIKKQMAQGNVIDVRNKRLGKTGPRPTEYTDEFLQSVPLYKRTTERSYGAALNISHVTIHKLKKKGRLRTHTSTNHPALTSNHKIARLKWVLSHLLPAEQNGNPKFEDMQEVIHIDEKWFYLNPETRRFYLLPNEPNPYRCQQSRRFKVKGIFMAAISKPIFDSHGHVLHDGKYGIFPFVYENIAKKEVRTEKQGLLKLRQLKM
ncbi:uncharacterized protein LOC110685465 [Chenopodium quinoa]|uniref:uncharacterized protein LOC110685465 n=1 Tax=Chenopodium quinoa TaxID=63459 RepID=UPI000B76F201|nr:uncharacterized protein LOC110685465 [Chenopodium quinoa]